MCISDTHRKHDSPWMPWNLPFYCILICRRFFPSSSSLPPPLLPSASSPVILMCAPLSSPLHYQVWLTAILLPRLLCHLSCSAMPAGWLHSTTACGDNNLHWSDPSAYPAVTNGNRLSCGSAIDCPTLLCVRVCVCVSRSSLCLYLLKCSSVLCKCRFIFSCYTPQTHSHELI